MVHRRARHYSQVTARGIDYPVLAISLRRTRYAPDNLLYRFALEETGAYSVGDFVQPVGFKLLAPLLQQSPLKRLRHCCGINLLGCDALKRNVFQYLLRDDAVEQVQLIPGLILNVVRQFACQRSVNRFVGLLVQVAHTGQQRSQAAGAVGISALPIQQHQ
ncbi:hypothetical protein ACM26S_18050 [Kluyvera sichuanensis]|uniref:hypothetical protein n=1 Tax=Kluyvera sichuanensis TaxID=2725494 RepID=UPI0039F6FCC9